MSDTVTREQFEQSGLADWRFVRGALHARFATGDFATGLHLVNLIGGAAEEADHHPDLDLRYPYVNVHLLSHDANGVTDRDAALARVISSLAADLGVAASPQDVAVMELALDTPDPHRIKPFWRAVFGPFGRDEQDDEVRNDHDLPTIWFQPSGAEEPRQRFHIDLQLPADIAQERIAAIVAAGGTVVDETATFTVLADVDGNRMCVCI